MNFLFNIALAFVIASSGFYWDRHHNPAKPRVDPVVEYERQVARGVAEQLLMLNRLGKAEALSLHAWKIAELEAQNTHSEGRADMFRSLFSNRFLVELAETSKRESARQRSYDQARKRRIREREEIKIAWREVLGWDFQRYFKAIEWAG